jgi:hypothetical protein
MHRAAQAGLIVNETAAAAIKAVNIPPGSIIAILTLRELIRQLYTNHAGLDAVVGLLGLHSEKAVNVSKAERANVQTAVINQTSGCRRARERRQSNSGEHYITIHI